MKNRGKNRKFSQEEKLTILKLSKMNIRYVGTKQVTKIYNFLYKDCGNLFLIRKKEKFENIQNKLKLGN